MLSISKLSASANECLGWPYESPGNNDKTGIDCSGLFVKMYRDQGAKIYHGSNTIFHDYCSETGKLTGENQLRAGMAVFKRKEWTDADKGNKWYGKQPGNLSHIGYVDSVSPLRIIHASSAAGEVTVDTKIGKLAYWGKLKDVDYGEEPSPSPSPEPEPQPEPEPEPSKTMQVYAENGKPVNMRVSPKLSAKLVDQVPVGQSVTWLKEDGAGWAYIQWKKKKGWMLECFLIEEGTQPPDPEPDVDPIDPDDPDEPDIDPTKEPYSVWAENGKPIHMRAQPSTSCKLYDDLPCGTEVEIVALNCTTDKKGNQWSKVNYGKRKGWYIMTKFLGVG